MYYDCLSVFVFFSFLFRFMGIVLVGFMHRASMVLENKKKTDKEMTGRVSLVLAEIYITKKSI